MPGMRQEVQERGSCLVVMKPKYKRMISLMLDREKSLGQNQMKEEWFLYILQCQDGSFYTGVTNDLQRRLKMHNDGRASRYTRSRRPVKLLYQEVYASRAQVLVREYAIKALSREKKEELVADGKL